MTPQHGVIATMVSFSSCDFFLESLPHKSVTYSHLCILGNGGVPGLPTVGHVGVWPSEVMLSERLWNFSN